MFFNNNEALLAQRRLLPRQLLQLLRSLNLYYNSCVPVTWKVSWSRHRKRGYSVRPLLLFHILQRARIHPFQLLFNFFHYFDGLISQISINLIYRWWVSVHLKCWGFDLINLLWWKLFVSKFIHDDHFQYVRIIFF